MMIITVDNNVFDRLPEMIAKHGKNKPVLIVSLGTKPFPFM